MVTPLCIPVTYPVSWAYRPLKTQMINYLDPIYQVLLGYIMGYQYISLLYHRYTVDGRNPAPPRRIKTTKLT